jgi:hypothetical protein
MTSSQYTLRLDILREAFDQYKAIGAALHATATEQQLAALKAMECEAMIGELRRETLEDAHTCLGENPKATNPSQRSIG